MSGGSGEHGVAPIWLFFFFIVFNISYNMLMLFIFRQGSSVLFVVAATVRLPLVDLLLMWRFVSGPAYSKFTLFDGFALFALIVGIVTYQSEPEIPGNGPRTAAIGKCWRWITCRKAERRKSGDSRKLLTDEDGDDYTNCDADKSAREDSYYGSTCASADPDNNTGV